MPWRVRHCSDFKMFSSVTFLLILGVFIRNNDFKTRAPSWYLSSPNIIQANPLNVMPRRHFLDLGVGCDGIFSPFISQIKNSCDVCKGDNSTCHIISGLFTRPQLPIGYNMITQIPRGACNLSILELKRSKNYLALRRPDGSFVMNGKWAINWSGDYQSNGTTFTYVRENETNLESIYSSGPLHEPLDLMVIYQQQNPGIKYNYQLPMKRQESDVYLLKDDPVIAPPFLRHTSDFSKTSDVKVLNENGINTKRYGKLPFSFGVVGKGLFTNQGEEDNKPRNIKNRKRKFVWKVTGYTKCSRFCGGGTQISIVQCVRLYNQMLVPIRRCSILDKPQMQNLRCNVKPCVAQWVGGEWNKCSVSCGEGIQTRGIICQQEITPTLIINVAEGACPTPPSPFIQTNRTCHMPPCSRTFNELTADNQDEWKIGAWSQCSTKCGLGIRTRHVICLSNNCSLNNQPTSQSVCDMGGCSNEQEVSHKWFYSEWSNQCSSSCGTGMQTRKVHCTGLVSQCDVNIQPESYRSCSSDKDCDGQWYAGPWGQCTSKCGWGSQDRSVVCITKLNGELVLTTEKKCLMHDKPLLEQECYIQSCEPEWYSSDWSQCSKSCDSGIQIREVRCFDEDHRITNRCTELSRPSTRQPCNTAKCLPSLDLRTSSKMQSDAVETLNDANPSEINSNSTNIYASQTTTVKSTTDIDSSVGRYESISNDVEDCVDIFTNCHLVVQARLCRYKYYNNSCCNTCYNRV